MKPAGKVFAWALVVGMIIGLIPSPAENTSYAAEQTGEISRNVESATPPRSGGAEIGFLSNTPDGTSLALNLLTRRSICASECVVRPAAAARFYRRSDPSRVLRSIEVLDRPSRYQQPG